MPTDTLALSCIWRYAEQDTAAFSSWYRLLEPQLVSQHRVISAIIFVICFDAARGFSGKPCIQRNTTIKIIELERIITLCDQPALLWQNLGSLVLAAAQAYPQLLSRLPGGECLFFLNACRIVAAHPKCRWSWIRTIDYARLTYLSATLVREIAAAGRGVLLMHQC